MAITFVKTPGNLHPAKNKAEFVLATDNQYTIPPADANRARVSFRIVADPVSAGNIKFFLGNPISGTPRELTFTFHASPNNSGTQLPTNAVSDPIDTYAGNVIAYLQKNYYIGLNYTVKLIASTLTTADIEIKANQEGIENSIEFQENLASNEVVGLSTAFGSNTTKRDNFKILYDVFAEKTWHVFDELPVFSGEGIPDASGNLAIDLKRVLTALSGFQVPPFTTGARHHLQTKAVRYCIKAAEYFGASPAPLGYYRSPSLATDYFIAYHGAADYKRYPFDTYYNTYINTFPQPFCTAMPTGKIKVHPQQKQFLTSWLRTQNMSAGMPQLTNYKLQVQLSYTDNTSSSWLDIATVSLKGEQFVTWRVGYTELNINGIKASGKTVASYKVRIMGTSLAHSAEFVFLVDNEQTRYPRHFTFINSFGFPESVYFYGDQERNIAFATTNIHRNDVSIDTEQKIFDGEFDETNTEWRRTFEISSGNKDRTHLQYFLDFISSPARYLQDVDKFVKINLSSDTIKLDDDQRTTFALRFAYSESFLERGIS